MTPRELGGTRCRQEIKVSYAILKLYANSGPVPVTIIKKLKAFVDAQAKKAA